MADLVDGWVPQACTLPTAEQPLRVQEFDDVFVRDLRGQRRVSPTVLRWSFDPAAQATVRDLTTRESECCSFFGFGFTDEEDALHVDVRVPADHVAVLDALEARAADGLRR